MKRKPAESSKTPVSNDRRRVLKASALAVAAGGTYGVAPFFGPWKHNHVWSQSAQNSVLFGSPYLEAAKQMVAGSRWNL